MPYSYPVGLVLALVRDAILGRKRSFRKDAAVWIRNLNPAPKIFGRDNIPERGPCVVTVNHYFRPGFQAGWLALGIAACISPEMHWVMTDELTFPGRWYAAAGRPMAKFVLSKIASTYDFTTMPPMPPRPGDVEARANSVRKVLKRMRQENVILGLAPEGGDQPGGRLSRPAPGAGRFALLLAGLGAEFVPVGAYEADGAFCLSFGEAYPLRVPPGLSPDQKDCIAAEIMIGKIAPLLPPYLRGEPA